MVIVQSKEGISNYGCHDVGYFEKGSQIEVFMSRKYRQAETPPL